MKKTMVCVLALVLAMTMSLSVFAAGGFVSSPGAKKGPELIDSSIDGCSGEIVITPYSDRDELDEEARKLLEEAYDQIAGNKDLSKICESLEELAEKLGIKVTDLAVSDLFNVGYTGCDDHDGHGKFTVTIRPENLNNFVALLALVNGEWVVVEDVTVEDGQLTFSGENYGPYAIVVNGAATPDTGDSFPWIYVVLMGVSAAGLIAVVVALKKKTA